MSGIRNPVALAASVIRSLARRYRVIDDADLVEALGRDIDQRSRSTAFAQSINGGLLYPGRGGRFASQIYAGE
jgi:hypothetical protein